MAPAKLLTTAGAVLIAAAVLVAAVLLSGRAGDATAILLRVDIMAAIVGVILSVSGLVFSDMRKLFWESARAAVRKNTGDKHA